MSERIGCSARVPDRGSWLHDLACSRKGKYEEKGKFYCKQHLPTNVKARYETRRAKETKEWDTKKNRWNRIAVLDTFCAGVSSEDIAELPSLLKILEEWK